MTHVQPIRCKRCDRQPAIVPIEVYYHTPRRKGVHDMWRVQCSCGTIGKCRPSKATAAEAWNEPWQAFVSPSPQGEQRAKRVCGVCKAVDDADHAGYCSESW